MRDLAFIDVETTGLEPDYHEIIEVAVARVDAKTLTITAEFDCKVRPKHPDRAEPEALRINGYSPERWSDALSQTHAIGQISPLLSGCILAGHNTSFDRSFIEAAFKRSGKTLPDLDYHVIDTVSLAWPLIVAGAIEKPKLRFLCEHLGISNQGEHSAPADVRRTIEVYRRLMPALDPNTMAHWSSMEADERAIATTVIERLHNGRTDYGPWHVDDGRNNPEEALSEVLDALNYCAAELVRLGRSA